MKKQYQLDLDSGVSPKVTIEHSHLGPLAYWAQADQIYKDIANSRVKWGSMDDLKRQAVTALVRQSLVKLYEEVDDWLPDSIHMDKLGDHMSVAIHFQVGDVDKQGDVMNMQFEADAAKLIKEMTQTLSTLE